VLEVVRLSDPFAMRGLDVVIPGTRDDLVQAWVKARLEGRGATDEDQRALAKEIAPMPDEHLTRMPSPLMKLRYRVDDKRQEEITRASRSFFARQRQIGEKPSADDA